MREVERVVRVDSRGRVVIPSEVRKALNIGRAVKLRVKDGAVILEPVEDPLEELSKLVVKVSVKASVEPRRLGETASRELRSGLGRDEAEKRGASAR